MERNDFEIRGEIAVRPSSTLQWEIPLQLLQEETLSELARLQEVYQNEIERIAEFCAHDFNFRFFLGNLTKADIVEKLQYGQRIFYTGQNGYIFFDPHEERFGRLAIRFDGDFNGLILEDECCEASQCEW